MPGGILIVMVESMLGNWGLSINDMTLYGCAEYDRISCTGDSFMKGAAVAGVWLVSGRQPVPGRCIKRIFSQKNRNSSTAGAITGKELFPIRRAHELDNHGTGRGFAAVAPPAVAL